jgi:hypothetical protein
MKGDFTRDTFDPSRHFSRVLMQQGRVQLDADFNEQAAILLHYLRTIVADLGGPYWGPADSLGFKITMLSNGDLTIGKGCYYVDGILCENNMDGLKYPEQEGYKEMPLPDTKKNYYVYLDVWERHITHVQDDRIREKALGAGGPDTCTRAKVIWQVRLHDVAGGTLTAEEREKIEEEIAILKKKIKRASGAEKKKLQLYLEELKKRLAASGPPATSCDDVKKWLDTLSKRPQPGMAARLHPERQEADACSIPPESRYRGAENQLYRIEIHRQGASWNGTTNGKGTPSKNAMQAATFKWSRDNGSIVFPIVRQEGNIVTLLSLGRDERTSLKVSDWVEILDDDRELRGIPGIMAQVDKVDLVEMTVTLKLPEDVPSSGFLWPAYDEKSANHPLLRRWDHRAMEGVRLSQGAILITESSDPENGWIEIEDGIEVQFRPVGAGVKYHTGDYWLVPARVATGNIEWPTKLASTGEEAEAMAPHGILHHYAPLAVIQKGRVEDKDRCRCKITPLKCTNE